MYNRAYILIATFILFSALSTPQAHSELPSQWLNQEEKIRAEMIQISKELGVTCVECHDTQNFKTQSKKTYGVAKEHMATVKYLRQNGFDGKKWTEANCYTCHRGKLKPDLTTAEVKH